MTQGSCRPSVLCLARYKVRLDPLSSPQFTHIAQSLNCIRETHTHLNTTSTIPTTIKFTVLSLAVAAAIGSACAQLDGLSACAINCLVTSIPVSGCSLTDTACLCASSAFHDAVASCLESSCTADDITAVLAFEDTECGTSD